MKKNDILTVAVTSTNSQGDGVAKEEGMVFFIPYALPGETVSIRVLKIKKNLVYAKLIDVLEKSPHRLHPSCDVFFQCGGCTALHLSYTEQLARKKQRVEEALIRIGKINTTVSDPIPSPVTEAYRNKALIPVGQNKDGEPTVGFYRSKSHQVIDSAACLIQDPDAFCVATVVKNWMKAYGIPSYEEETHTGLIRHLYFRKGIHTGQIMAGIVTAKKDLPYEKELIFMILAALPGVVSIIQNINPEKTNVILGKKVRLLYGTLTIEDHILNNRFLIGSLSFFQVNPYAVAPLYQKALDLLALNKEEILFDLYCGIGTIGICAAKEAKEIYGIEAVPEAIQLAKENAKLNNLTNTHFFTGKAEEEIFNLIQAGIQPDAVVVDPPRAGCHPELIQAIKTLAPKKICYVSCDPATLARDLNLFIQEDYYEIREVVPVDMFPHTSHVECIILMTKCGFESDK